MTGRELAEECAEGVFDEFEEEGWGEKFVGRGTVEGERAPGDGGCLFFRGFGGFVGGGCCWVGVEDVEEEVAVLDSDHCCDFLFGFLLVSTFFVCDWRTLGVGDEGHSLGLVL